MPPNLSPLCATQSNKVYNSIEIVFGGIDMKHWLEIRATEQPDFIAIETDESQMTFKELYAHSVEFGKKLKSLNVPRLGFYVNNTIEAIIAVHAAWLYGIEVVMINHRLTSNEIIKQLDSVNVRDVITTKPIELSESINVYLYHEVQSICNSEPTAFADFNIQNIASIMFTSGTTGPQKAVPQRFKNHLASAKKCKATLGFSSESKWLTVLPIYHISGLSIIIRSAIYGFTVYLKEKFDVVETLECIKSKQLTHVSLVPQTLIRLMNGGLDQPYTLEKILLGGAKLDETMIQSALERELPIYNSFGMTETCSQFLTASPKMLKTHPNTVGVVGPSQEIKISQPNAQGHGILCVKGQNVMEGYLYPSEVNSQAFDDEGFFNTGDIASVNDGYVAIYDRRKDLIISGGENIYPFEIEALTKTFHGVEDAMCVGIPDDTWGERPILYVVSSIGEKVITGLQELLNERLAKYKHPKAIYLVETLPYTSTGKLQRQVLNEGHL